MARSRAPDWLNAAASPLAVLPGVTGERVTLARNGGVVAVLDVVPAVELAAPVDVVPPAGGVLALGVPGPWLEPPLLSTMMRITATTMTRITPRTRRTAPPRRELARDGRLPVGEAGDGSTGAGVASPAAGP